jgi:hypothetical protein
MPELDDSLIPASYAALSPENVETTRRLLRDLWKSAAPDLDVDHGALSALLLNPAATLLEVGRETFRQARKGSNLAALLSDPSDASRLLLDELAASYRVERKTGTKSSGRIRLYFQENLYRVIGLSTTFQANGILFHIRHVETLQSAGDIPSTLPHYQNLKETQDGSGQYYADVTVYARSPGAVANLVRGTELTLYQSSLPYFVRAVTMETFSGGGNEEGDESLVRRMVLGISAKVLSSRINMRAALLEKFPDIRDSSVIGAGDREMTRDQHTVFPGSTGGYADWYVGTTRQLAAASVVTDAVTVLETAGDGSTICRVVIDDGMISCLFHVTEIHDEDTLEPCRILSQTRFVRNDDALRSGNAPRIHDDGEGAFTAYQVTDVCFHSPKQVTRIRVYGIHAPGIRAIQDWVLQCGQAPIGLDLLVKGAIPSVIRFSAVLHTPTGAEIEPITLQGIVADHINHLPFGGLLTISGLTSLLHRNLPAGCYVTKPTLFATTYLPDGRTALTETSDRLEIDAPPFASNRTSLFFCDPADVSLELRYVERDGLC